MLFVMQDEARPSSIAFSYLIDMCWCRSQRPTGELQWCASPRVGKVLALAHVRLGAELLFSLFVIVLCCASALNPAHAGDACRARGTDRYGNEHFKPAPLMHYMGRPIIAGAWRYRLRQQPGVPKHLPADAMHVHFHDALQVQM